MSGVLLLDCLSYRPRDTDQCVGLNLVLDSDKQEHHRGFCCSALLGLEIEGSMVRRSGVGSSIS